MPELIQHIELTDGIHELKFLQKNRLAVDTFYQKMAELYQAPTLHTGLYLLVDVSLKGTLPLQYMYQQSHLWRSRNPLTIPVRTAILYPHAGVLPIVNVLLNVVTQSRNGTLRLQLFKADERALALAWLLEEKP